MTFCFNRVIWGSEWPVCNMGFGKMYLAGEFSLWESWHGLATKMMLKLGQDEDALKKLFQGNKARVYNLVDVPY